MAVDLSFNVVEYGWYNYSLRDCCRTRTVSIDPPHISVLMMAAIKELKLPPTPPKYMLHLKGMRDHCLHDGMCCYNCGVFGDLKPISDEMKRSFQSVHPICTNCSTQGKK